MQSLWPDGVTPLILRASKTTTRFSSRSSNFLQFQPKNTPEKVKNPKFSWGGGGGPCLQTLPTCTLIAYWKPPFQNSRSATVTLPTSKRCYNPPNVTMMLFGDKIVYRCLIVSGREICVFFNIQSLP